mmetsp:Transcript_77955/g.216563  ORF Transcript_77955/g.216563 Transcript_77955/m.216563 type:complete len:335 (-) Transcript_77955:1095-2099(-)
MLGRQSRSSDEAEYVVDFSESCNVDNFLGCLTRVTSGNENSELKALPASVDAPDEVESRADFFGFSILRCPESHCPQCLLRSAWSFLLSHDGPMSSCVHSLMGTTLRSKISSESLWCSGDVPSPEFGGLGGHDEDWLDGEKAVGTNDKPSACLSSSGAEPRLRSPCLVRYSWRRTYGLDGCDGSDGGFTCATRRWMKSGSGQAFAKKSSALLQALILSTGVKGHRWENVSDTLAPSVENSELSQASAEGLSKRKRRAWEAWGRKVGSLLSNFCTNDFKLPLTPSHKKDRKLGQHLIVAFSFLTLSIPPKGCWPTNAAYMHTPAANISAFVSYAP